MALWMYHPATGAKLFNDAADVPKDEDWQDSPIAPLEVPVVVAVDQNEAMKAALEVAHKATDEANETLKTTNDELEVMRASMAEALEQLSKAQEDNEGWQKAYASLKSELTKAKKALKETADAAEAK